MSIEAAAALVGVDEGTWGRWERGEWKPTSRTIAAIDAFLGRSCREDFPEAVR